MFSFLFRKKNNFTQSSTEQWRTRWQALVPPECRDVSVTLDGREERADILINHYAVVLQDGMQMDESFFPRCRLFLKANYYVICLTRCTQDIERGDLCLLETDKLDNSCLWDWKKPTTNIGRWISRQTPCSILLQCRELPEDFTEDCTESVLQRIRWADSDGESMNIPNRSRLTTTPKPASPKGFAQWLRGTRLSELEENEPPA